MDGFVVTHFHHHFTFYVDDGAARGANRSVSAVSLSQTVDLLVDDPVEAPSHAKHVHRHLFHRLKRSGKDALAVSEDDKTRARSSVGGEVASLVQHHFYDTVRVRNKGDMMASLVGVEAQVSSLRQMLRSAVRLELSTVPPYLYALYSLKDRDSVAYSLLKSIVVEEMLHAGLAANMLTAIGGVVPFYEAKSMTRFPLDVPYVKGLTLELKFMRLEQPMQLNLSSAGASFASIGAFYSAIEALFEKLAQDEPDLFATPRVDLQLRDKNYKVVTHNTALSGELHPVASLEDVRQAIATIVNQGEGVEDSVYADALQSELTHYRKLELLRDDPSLACYPCAENPKEAEFPPAMRAVSALFNASYALLMLTMQELYTEVDGTGRLNARMYALMEKFMRPLAQLLCATPLDGQRHCGPTFELFAFAEGADPAAVVRDLAAPVLEQFPELQEKLGKGLKLL